MAARPRQLTPHVSARHFFGAELRRWRTRRRWSQARLASQVFVSPDLIRKIEHAERSPSEVLAGRCDDLLQTGGALRRLVPLLGQGQPRTTRTTAADDAAETGFVGRMTLVALTVDLGVQRTAPSPLEPSNDAVIASVVSIMDAPSRRGQCRPR